MRRSCIGGFFVVDYGDKHYFDKARKFRRTRVPQKTMLAKPDRFFQRIVCINDDTLEKVGSCNEIAQDLEAHRKAFVALNAEQIKQRLREYLSFVVNLDEEQFLIRLSETHREEAVQKMFQYFEPIMEAIAQKVPTLQNQLKSIAFYDPFVEKLTLRIKTSIFTMRFK